MIRIATANDYELVEKYFNQLIEESVYGAFFPGIRFTEDFFTPYLVDPEKLLIIITCDDQDVGFAHFDTGAWNPMPGYVAKYARIPYILIDKKYRKKGLMSDVLEGFEHWAKRVDAGFVMVGTKGKKSGYKKSEVIYIKDIR